jgi:hypothetical protein
MDLELSAVASVPLEIPEGAQRPLFGSKYMPLGRARCILKSETFNSFTGFVCVLFVCELRPVSALGSPSWTTWVTWVVSHVS